MAERNETALKSSYRFQLPPWGWVRDAGWRETLHVLTYPIRTWRCRLFGHKWGPEQSDWDTNVGALMMSWRDCERDGCEGWWETYHHMAGGKQRVLG